MKKNLKKYAFTGAYYSLEFKGVSSAAEIALLEAVHAVFSAAEIGGDWRDIRSFDLLVKALLPPGYISGGGAHHVWIHREEDEGKRPGEPSFGIWAMQDYQLYYKIEASGAFAEWEKPA
jgi:hypothetical protein